jgi:hypothetical protein
MSEKITTFARKMRADGKSKRNKAGHSKKEQAGHGGVRRVETLKKGTGRE